MKIYFYNPKVNAYRERICYPEQYNLVVHEESMIGYTIISKIIGDDTKYDNKEVLFNLNNAHEQKFKDFTATIRFPASMTDEDFAHRLSVAEVSQVNEIVEKIFTNEFEECNVIFKEKLKKTYIRNECGKIEELC